MDSTKVVCAPARPPRPVDLRTTRKYRVYLSIFEVILKNIQRICTLCPVRAWHNRQARPPARSLRPPARYARPLVTPTRSLRPPVSLQTPSMTTMDSTNRWILSFEKLLLVKWTRVIMSVLLPVQCKSLPMPAKFNTCKLVNIY
jgi:hypothetical protein